MFNFRLNQKNKKGFTLIEMMVSVSIFVIVAFIVVSTLLTLSYAYKKAQKMRLLMDNFNFALQSMSVNIREGINYEICSNGNSNCFSFIPIDNWMKNDVTKVCYSLSSDNSILKCSDSCPCISNSGNLSRLISPEINVTNLTFKIEGSGNKRKAVKIMVDGKAGGNQKELSSFFIQNTVSQRNPNI